MARILQGFVGSLLLLAVSVSVSFALAELGVRWWIPQKPVRGYAVANAQLGTILLPHQNYLDDLSPQYFTYAVRTNAQGMRMDEDVDPSQGRRKIIALGDSFTFGWGVDIEKSFFQQIKTKVESANPEVQLLNGGVGAYSTGHVLKSLKRWHGMIDLSAVIYFFNANDLQDNINTNVNYRVASYKVTQYGDVKIRDELVYSNLRRFLLTRIGLYDWLNKNSHLFVLAKLALKVNNSEAAPRVSVDDDFLTSRNERLVHEVSLAHVRRLADYARQCGLRLLIVWVPDARELAPQGFPFFSRFKRKLVEMQERLGYDFFDPSERMGALSRSTGVDSIYFPEGHYNPLGNSYYAASVEDIVARFSANN